MRIISYNISSTEKGTQILPGIRKKIRKGFTENVAL